MFKLELDSMCSEYVIHDILLHDFNLSILLGDFKFHKPEVIPYRYRPYEDEWEKPITCDRWGNPYYKGWINYRPEQKIIVEIKAPISQERLDDIIDTLKGYQNRVRQVVDYDYIREMIEQKRKQAIE